MQRKHYRGICVPKHCILPSKTRSTTPLNPGGLPSDLSEKEFLRGRESVLRNPILAGVFARLGIIERFGTGTRRIRECYKDLAMQPQFEVFENSVSLTLPAVNAAVGLEKTKTIRILNSLIGDRIIEKFGSGDSEISLIFSPVTSCCISSFRSPLHKSGSLHTASWLF